jgi:MFS family permease
VYQSQVKSDLRDKSSAADTTRLGRAHVRRNVWLLGITSLLTDMSSEMVVAVLPLYALYFLHLSPAAFGVVDGLQQGGASIVKLAGGWFTDRTQRHKTVAATGYIASALSRLGLVAAGPSALLLTPLIALDRIGKGIRTAPRDAIISLSVPRGALAAAFGVHRALDTFGAMLGPIIGFAILQWVRDGYDIIFVVSLALGSIGVAVLVAFVESPARQRQVPAEVEPAVATAAWPRRFVRIALSAGVLGLASISDSFIYLSLQRTLGFNAELLPLLYVATPAVYLTLAAPAGRIADRVGSTKVILVGYAALCGVYLLLASSLAAVPLAIASVVLLGVFYASTDGVFAALASAELPVARRATGLAIVGTSNDVGRMIASVTFGWLWSRGTPVAAVQQFQVALVVAVTIATCLLWPIVTRRVESSEPHG